MATRMSSLPDIANALFRDQQPELRLGVTAAGILSRLQRTFGPHLQISPQVGLALPDPVSNLAAVERGEAWIGQLAPRYSLQFLQRMDVAI